MNSSEILAAWPAEAREAAQLVVDKYGEPDEAQPSQLIWFNAGEWKRIVATRSFWEHQFPSPHHDSVESFVDYRVPPELFSELAAFDGSVVAHRTTGEMSAMCHDEEANRLALNLAHDMITGVRDVQNARAYYTKEFLDARRRVPTPYMAELRFVPAEHTADADTPSISEQELNQAVNEGKSMA